MTYIEVKDITFQYEICDTPVLDDIHFSLDKGEWLCVLGMNGSGKSTLIHWLMGFLQVQKGLFLVEGKLVWGMPEDTQECMALVMQNPEDQFIGVTVRDDIAFGLENMGIPSTEMQIRVEEALRMVGMEEYGDVAPQQLSGGQMQRLALAGAYAMQKEILFLDEATSMLDPKGKKEWLDALRRLRRERNCTIISVTHDMEETRYADKILVLKEGKQLYFGSPRSFFMQGDLVKQSGLGYPFHYQVENMMRKYMRTDAQEILRRMGWENEI